MTKSLNKVCSYSAIKYRSEQLMECMYRVDFKFGKY